MRRRRPPFGLLVIACVAALAVTATFVGTGAFAGVAQNATVRTANNQPLTPAQKRAAAKKAAARRAAAKLAAAKRLAAKRAAAARAAAARRAYNRPEAVYARGKALFKQNCSSCHTLAAAGTHGHVGPDLDGANVSYGDVIFMVTNGNGLMPGRGPSGTLTNAQIRDIATFVSKASE